MDFRVPPGLVYLSKRLPRLLLLPVSVYLIVLANHVQISQWLLVLLSVFSLPVAFTVSVLYTDYVNQRRAAALGAVLPSRLSSKWPGGFSTLKAMVNNFKMGKHGNLPVLLFFSLF
jgi:hypothetical protein